MFLSLHHTVHRDPHVIIVYGWVNHTHQTYPPVYYTRLSYSQVCGGTRLTTVSERTLGKYVFISNHVIAKRLQRTRNVAVAECISFKNVSDVFRLRKNPKMSSIELNACVLCVYNNRLNQLNAYSFNL